MRRFDKALLAGAVALACSAPAAAQYSGIFVFGDSLNDGGQFGTRATTNPGLVAPQYLAERFGLLANPSFTGGTNYAVGGARVSTVPPGLPPSVPYHSVHQQVTAFLTRGTPDAGALYIVEGGGNDILALVNQLQAGAITPAQMQAGVVQAATELAAQAGRLQAAGARNILVMAVPDPGRSLVPMPPGFAPQVSALGDLFNSTLAAALSAANLRVGVFNFAGLHREILANPAAFGFTNVTQFACTSSSSSTCNQNTLAAPNANMTYFYADAIHPTTGAHLLVAAAMASILEAPSAAATLTEGPLAVEQAAFRAIDARMWSAFDAPYDPQRAGNFWASYDYTSVDVETGFARGDGDLNTVSVGGDMRIGSHWLAGAAANFSTYKASYSVGRHKLEETSGTLYAGWGNGPWYAGVSALFGSLDYSDVARTFALGALQRTESGDASGDHWALRVHGGYWMRAGSVNHGPFAKLVYQRADVDGFTERSGSSTALSYAGQERESLLASVGWQAQGSFGALRPFGRVTWEFELKDDPLSVTTNTGLGGSFTTTLPAPDDNWALFQAGAAMDFGPGGGGVGRVTGYIMGTATAGKGTGDSYAVTVGVRVPL